MILERIDNPSSLDRVFKIVLTDKDICDVCVRMTSHDKFELDYFGREDATIEERLMGLQVYARVLERIAA